MTAALSYLWSNPAARYVRPASSPFSSVRKTIARLVGALNVGLSGRFHVVKRRVADDSIVEAREFENIITDAGLNRWGSGGVIDRCMVGSGNTTPTASDVSLVSRVATSTTVQNPTTTFAFSAVDRWQEYSVGYRFAAGAATGTLAEVAVGWADTGIWSRALIRDTSGNPTSLTLLADEYLDVFYTVRLQYPSTDVTGTVVLGGTNYAWAMRPIVLSSNTNFGYMFGGAFCSYVDGVGGSAGCYAEAYSGDLVATSNTYPTGKLSTNSTVTTIAPYVDGSATGVYARDLEFTFNTSGAVGSLKTAVFLLYRAYSAFQTGWQCAFTPAIPKTNTQTLKLTLRVSWARE